MYIYSAQCVYFAKIACFDKLKTRICVNNINIHENNVTGSKNETSNMQVFLNKKSLLLLSFLSCCKYNARSFAQVLQNKIVLHYHYHL